MSSIHLSDDGLLAFVEGTVSVEDRVRWMLHVDECRPCHDLLAAAAPAVGSSPNDDPLTDLTAVGSAGDAPSSASVVRGTRVGRFTILDRIGVGATAEVHAAYDSQLDRKVALKLLRTRTPAGDLRLLREAQALARLSHPNVVSVFDAGDHGDRSFVAMEFVVGDTLRRWVSDRSRPWADVVRMFVAAGRGLAAAHAVGIVHRDFKPDNVLVGSDGRPRVADFGLARAHAVPVDDGDDTALPVSGAPPTDELTGRGATVGTPVYMAPEQLRGEPATPASDQFAFCVALWEGLYGLRPFVTRGSRRAAIERGEPGEPPPGTRVPSIVRRALARGLAARAPDRWRSVDHLLDALERALPRRRRRALIGGGAFGLASAAIAVVLLIRLYRSDHALEPCTGGRAELAATWNAGWRAAVIAHLRQLGGFAASEADRLAAELDGYGERWVESHRAACLASERGELTAQLYDRNLTCLAQSRAALGAIAELLATVPSDRVPAATAAAHSLPDAVQCPNQALGSTAAPPPAHLSHDIAAVAAELSRIRIRALAADPDAPAAAAAAVARSAQLGYIPLAAQARLVEGLVWLSRGEMPRAIAPLHRATIDALTTGDDASFVEAYARLLFVVSVSPSSEVPAEAAQVASMLPMVEQIAIRLGPAAAFARPLLYNNAGAARTTVGDKPGARRWFERALAEPRTQAGDVELSIAFGNLAGVVESDAERERLLDAEHAILERRLGRDHLRALENRLKVAMLIAHPAAASAALGDVCARLRTFASEAREDIDLCTFELGWLAVERGDRVGARLEMAAVRGRRSDVARCFVDLYDGKLEQAAREAGALVKPDLPWWQTSNVASALVAAADAHVALREPAAAVEALERALRVLESAAGRDARIRHGRRVAEVQARLAVLQRARRPDVARRLASEASEWYRSIGGYDARLAELAPIVTSGSR